MSVLSLSLSLSLSLALGGATLSHASTTPRAVESEPDGDARIIDVRAIDLDGELHSLGNDDGLRPVVLVFLDPACPIAKRYVPRLGELHELAGELKTEFYGVLSDPALSSIEAREYRDAFELEFPVLFDASGELARRLGPTHVPEAFVIDAHDALVYRGRIDDRFESPGVLRQVIGTHDLADAMRAVAAGRAPSAARTEPVGCVFEAWDAPRAENSITYTRDVAPILRANCLDCHRKGDIGPFALDSYSAARRRAKMIALVCNEGTMPPWQAEPGYGAFKDERTLSEGEIAVLNAWAESGAPEGDLEELLPSTPVSDSRWRLGEPDLVVEMPVDFELPAQGEDIYRYFVIPSPLEGEQSVVAFDFRPGDPSVVHHCIVYLDHSGWAREMDARVEGPGFSVFGEYEEQARSDEEILFNTEQIGGWAPGAQPYQLPPGLGQKIPGGGEFVIEVHYHLSGKRTTDRSAFGLYFAKEPVERYVEGLVIGTEKIDIEPGDGDYRRRVWMELPTDIELIDISPHMHYIGKEVDALAILPDGTEEALIKIDDWDFRWQGTYVYREPLRLPKGTRIEVRFRFDNSAENPFNPSSPPIRVKEGWRTIDEMCLFYLTVVPDDPRKTDALYMAMFGSFMRSAEW